MSFLTVVEQDATEVENAVVDGLKTAVGYVENVTVVDILPALETVLLNAIEKLGQEAVAALLGSAVASSGTSGASGP